MTRHTLLYMFKSSLSFSKWTHLTTVWPFCEHVPAAESLSFMLGFLRLGGCPFHPTALLFLTPQEIKQRTFIQMPDSASTRWSWFHLINCMHLGACLHCLWLERFCKSANQNESWELRARHKKLWISYFCRRFWWKFIFAKALSNEKTNCNVSRPKIPHLFGIATLFLLILTLDS